MLEKREYEILRIELMDALLNVDAVRRLAVYVF